MTHYLELENGEELYCSKIICVGRNYNAHIEELNNTKPTEPMYFIKPNSAIVTEGQRIFLPKFSTNIHHEVELAVVIGKSGKHIPKDRVNDYILGYGIGLDLTARDLQTELKEKGYPWEKAKAFDGSCPISKIRLKENVTSHNDLEIELKINNEVRQHSRTSRMIFDVETLISDASNYFTLQKGDIILTGTPEGVGQVKSGDILIGTIENVGQFHFEAV